MAQLNTFVDPERRLPHTRYEYVTVTFPLANEDRDIAHLLNPLDPETIKYQVTQQSAPAVIYQDLSGTRRPWERTHIFLRASQPTTAIILLWLPEQPVDLITQIEAPEAGCTEGIFSRIHRVGDDSSQDAVADDACDTLNLKEGTGIVIAVNPDTDTVTISTTCCDDVGGTVGGEECPIHCVESAQLIAPPAANGVSLTPGGSAWTAGAWVEIDAATTAPWILTSLAVIPGFFDNPGGQFEIDIGIGSTGNETVVGTLPGFSSASTGSAVTDFILTFPIPLDVVPQGSRVAARIRIAGTDVTPWLCAVSYYAKPVTGTIYTASTPCFVYPPAATRIGITPSGSNWGNSSWVEVVGATGSDWIIGGIVLAAAESERSWELDIGIGASGSETVVSTIRGRVQSSFTSAFRDGPYYRVLRPCIDAVPAGSRVAIRMRKDGTSVSVWRFGLVFYREHVAGMSTAEPWQCFPSATDSVSITPDAAGSFALGAWTFMFTTTAATAIAALVPDGHDTGGGGLLHLGLDFTGDGTPDVYHVYRITGGGSVSGDNHWMPLNIALNVPTATGIYMRYGNIVGTDGQAFDICYIEDPDFANRVQTFQQRVVSGTVSSTGAWANGAWVEVVSNLGEDSRFVAYYAEATFEAEYDIGLGASGSEVVATTVRCADTAGTSGGGTRYQLFPVPFCVAADQRVAVRMRAASNTSGTMAIMYQPQADGPGTCGPDGTTAGDTNPAFTVAVSDEAPIVIEDGGTLGLLPGTNITLTTDAEAQTVTVAAPDVATSGSVTTSGLTMNTARLLGRTTASAGAVEEITAGSGLTLSAGTLTATSGGASTRSIGITIDGAGSAITTGVKGYAQIPYAATITAVTMLADQSGSAVVDVWKDTYANYPPTDADSITASAVPTISAATKSQDTTLTGWTTSISANDVLGFNVDSAATITRLTLQLTVET